MKTALPVIRTHGLLVLSLALAGCDSSGDSSGSNEDGGMGGDAGSAARDNGNSGRDADGPGRQESGGGSEDDAGRGDGGGSGGDSDSDGDSGSGGDSDGSTGDAKDNSCDGRKTSADDEVARALDAHGSCDHSSDCTLSGRNRLASCEFHRCAVAVSVADVASFDAKIDEIDAEYCESFRAECDSPGGGDCVEQHDTARCEAGRCVPATSIPCAERSAAFTEILTEHDARACQNDDDCTTLSDELDAALRPVDDYCALAVSNGVDQEALTLAIQSLPVEADCKLQACTAIVCAGGAMPPFVPRCIDNVCSNVQDPCP